MPATLLKHSELASCLNNGAVNSVLQEKPRFIVSHSYAAWGAVVRSIKFYTQGSARSADQGCVNGVPAC
jgi:hypothetical protein